MISRGFSGCHRQKLGTSPRGHIYGKVEESAVRTTRIKDWLQQHQMTASCMPCRLTIQTDVRYARLRLVFSCTVKRGNSQVLEYCVSAGERSEYLAKSYAGTQAQRGGPPKLEWRWWEAVPYCNADCSVVCATS